MEDNGNGKSNILKPGEIVVTIKVSPPLVVGGQSKVEINTSPGEIDAFMLRKLYRMAEDAVMGQLEVQLKQPQQNQMPIIFPPGVKAN